MGSRLSWLYDGSWRATGEKGYNQSILVNQYRRVQSVTASAELYANFTNSFTLQTAH